MTPKLPQPFEQDAIRKDPKAVVIGLLIGLLLIFGGVIGVLYYREQKREDDCKEDIEELNKLIIKERDARIFFYEQLIFYKQKSETQAVQDSVTRKKTEPLVQKILQ